MKPLGVITIASKPLDFKYLAVIAVLFLTANGLFSVMAKALGREMKDLVYLILTWTEIF